MATIREKMINAAAVDPTTCVQEWLKKKSCDECPFSPWVGRYDCHICKAMFPKIVSDIGIKIKCPCYTYGRKYVIRRAREAVKK